jgi:hypothetical protein
LQGMRRQGAGRARQLRRPGQEQASAGRTTLFAAVRFAAASRR